MEENIKLFWEMQGIKNSLQNELLEDLLEEFEILHLKKSKAISLSGGERRRLEIARALAQNPDYLLLDEPFSGVDPIATKELQVIIKKIVQKGKIYKDSSFWTILLLFYSDFTCSTFSDLLFLSITYKSIPITINAVAIINGAFNKSSK